MQKTFTFNLDSVVFFFFILMMPGHCRDCDVVCLCLSVWIQPEQRILSVCLSVWINSKPIFLSVCLSVWLLCPTLLHPLPKLLTGLLRVGINVRTKYQT